MDMKILLMIGEVGVIGVIHGLNHRRTLIGTVKTVQSLQVVFGLGRILVLNHHLLRIVEATLSTSFI